MTGALILAGVLLAPMAGFCIWLEIQFCKPLPDRPDYARIAELERELLGVEPSTLTERYARPDLIQQPRRRLGSRRGYVSGSRSGEELGPMPEAWTRMRREFRMCEHERTDELHTYGAGRWLYCRDCGAKVDMTTD